MTSNDIYNQGYFSAKNNLGTISELCSFHYSKEQFKLWCRGYENGRQSRLIDEGKGYRENGIFYERRANCPR